MKRHRAIWFALAAGCVGQDPPAADDDGSSVAVDTAAMTPANALPDGGPAARTCDTVGRVVKVQLRLSSTRGHLNDRRNAIYIGSDGMTWYKGENLRHRTSGRCAEEPYLRHSSEATFPIKISCEPAVDPNTGRTDPTQICQPHVDPQFEDIKFKDPEGTKAIESDFLGRYKVGEVAGLEIENLRESTCFHHQPTTTGAHFCTTKSDTTASVLPQTDQDKREGARSFAVALGAGFVHSLHALHDWKVVLGGVNGGVTIGPINAGANVNTETPTPDESSGWISYRYKVQCAPDGKPYLVERLLTKSQGNSSIDVDWTSSHQTDRLICKLAEDEITSNLAKVQGETDLAGELMRLLARVRTRDIDCFDAYKRAKNLLDNKKVRDVAKAKREQVTGQDKNQHVLAALDALEAWLRDPASFDMPRDRLQALVDALARALRNLDLRGTLRGYLSLYAGRMPAFDQAVNKLLALLEGATPPAQADVDAQAAEVDKLLREVVKNEVCRVRALAMLPGDEKRWSEFVESKEPYLAEIKTAFAAAKAKIEPMTSTCAEVGAALDTLKKRVELVSSHKSGEKLVDTERKLFAPKCLGPSRAEFDKACDDVIAKLKAIGYADPQAVRQAAAQLHLDWKRLCEPRTPVENKLPPVVVPTPQAPAYPDDWFEKDSAGEIAAPGGREKDGEDAEDGENGENGDYNEDEQIIAAREAVDPTEDDLVLAELLALLGERVAEDDTFVAAELAAARADEEVAALLAMEAAVEADALAGTTSASECAVTDDPVSTAVACDACVACEGTACVERAVDPELICPIDAIDEPQAEPGSRVELTPDTLSPLTPTGANEVPGVVAD